MMKIFSTVRDTRRGSMSYMEEEKREEGGGEEQESKEERAS